MDEPKGLLLAIMQPTSDLEEEFNDWYDTEHTVQRAEIDGFLSARRFVCLDGFPRYAAAYDLRDYGVLEGPGYKKLSGAFSPWSKRILTRVNGQSRIEGPQIYPRHASYGDAGSPARMGLLRLRGVARDAEAAMIERMRKAIESKLNVLQIRVFRSEYAPDPAHLVMIEALADFKFDQIHFESLGDDFRRVDLMNLYAPYWRRGYLAGVT
ncbi:hypothetical protein [Rhizobium sp. PP-F2F-G48]|uniref:hypothetical protein n=1 Tax=Rhizobium sp. PP-F2F-G48 TaxID=2135651 RepID=UPI0010494695|nr:hypothetical protein [Rhizobium sp. PP-F2F-G48]